MVGFPFFHNFLIFNHTIHTEGGSLQHHQCGMVLESFLVRLIRLFPIYLMCLILLKINLSYWWFFLKIFFSLCAIIRWIIFHLPVVYLLYNSTQRKESSMTCCNVVGSFLHMFMIHTLVIFLAGNTRFCGMLYVDWGT